jgi:hypothetical protein
MEKAVDIRERVASRAAEGPIGEIERYLETNGDPSVRRRSDSSAETSTGRPAIGLRNGRFGTRLRSMKIWSAVAFGLALACFVPAAEASRSRPLEPASTFASGERILYARRPPPA